MPLMPMKNNALTPRNPLHQRTLMVLTIAIDAYALARHKLTPVGAATAFAVALLHITYPSDVPFWALMIFFLAGVVVSRVGKQAKGTLTASATGGSGAEGMRNAVQVLANSGTACILILISLIGPQLLRQTGSAKSPILGELTQQKVDFAVCCAYAAAAADTFSSELGILSSSSPFMITPPFRKVPRGTNGGVTAMGLGAAQWGSSLLAALYYYHYLDVVHAGVIVVLGVGGSVIDSLLGALVQATVEDKSTGRVIEGANGRRVMVGKGGSRVQRGLDLLNNNGVNFAMTLTIGLLGFAVYPLL